jgi:heme/copper-type cytochrome/quinol oxidase subunit 2
MRRFRLSQRWIVIGLLALAIVMVPNPIALAARAERAGPAEQHFRIEASTFQYTPEAIAVNPGDHVTIDLVATDVVHGLYIDGYDLNVTADPGQTATLSFFADRSGSFRFRCSVTCGALHPFMIGKLNVGSNDLLWRAIGLSALAVVAGIWVRSKGERR